jgi:hypothetical protein
VLTSLPIGITCNYYAVCDGTVKMYKYVRGVDSDLAGAGLLNTLILLRSACIIRKPVQGENVKVTSRSGTSRN